MSRKKKSTWETEQEYFPSTMRSLMKDRNITQKELADAIGVRPQTVSLYVTGQSAPDIHCLKKIAEFFDVSSDYLLGLSGVKALDVDKQDIHKLTGLSSEAINVILHIAHIGEQATLDKFIGNSRFVQLIKLVHRLSQAKSKDDLQMVLTNPFKDISEDYVYESVATNMAARLISDVSDKLSGRDSSGKHQERN